MKQRIIAPAECVTCRMIVDYRREGWDTWIHDGIFQAWKED